MITDLIYVGVSTRAKVVAGPHAVAVAVAVGAILLAVVDELRGVGFMGH